MAMSDNELKTKENKNEAFQGVKVTSDTDLKTGDMGLSKHRPATPLNQQNTTVTQ